MTDNVYTMKCNGKWNLILVLLIMIKLININMCNNEIINV